MSSDSEDMEYGLPKPSRKETMQEIQLRQSWGEGEEPTMKQYLYQLSLYQSRNMTI